MRVVAVLLLFAGSCATVPRVEMPDTLPRVVHQVPLPSIPWPVQVGEQTLDVSLHIAADGTVTDAALLTPTVWKEWNERAIECLRRWRFEPATYRGKPIGLWIRQTIRLQIEGLHELYLAELVCADRVQADSISAFLEQGEDFGRLVQLYSIADSRNTGGVLGMVDIRRYPKVVQDELRKLQPGEVTPPLEIGKRFVIFKRLVGSTRVQSRRGTGATTNSLVEESKTIYIDSTPKTSGD